jgi:hypothetical protein
MDDQIKEDGMGETYNLDGGDEFIQHFVGKL